MKIVYLLAAVASLNLSTFVQADDNNAPRRPEGRERRGGQNPEQVARFARILGLNPEELKNLSQQERQAKFKEAAEKKSAELEKKKTDGSITDEEQRLLDRMNERKNHGGDHAGGPGQSRGREEMIELVKKLGLNPADLKDLSHEERQAKIKEAADKKFAELQKKKADGSLTDDEKQMLQRMEERHKRREEHAPKADGDK